MAQVHLYVPTSWKTQHLGEEFLGTVKILRRKHWMDYEECSLDDSSHSIQFVRLPLKMVGTDRIKLKRAIENHFHQRCFCEHDCCGHWFGGVQSTTFLNKRDIVIHTSYSRNV